jgi:hypothetical protein
MKQPPRGYLMNHKHLIAGSLVAFLAALAQAEDKPKLPEGSPPRLASVIEVKGDLVVYRDFYFTPPIPKKAGQFNLKEPVPSHPSGGPKFACAVEFPLKDGEVFDAEGKKLNADAAKKRLAVGDTVLVSTSGSKVDPVYLRVVKKETLVFVHPAPPPGPPLPKNDPPEENK